MFFSPLSSAYSVPSPGETAGMLAENVMTQFSVQTAETQSLALLSVAAITLRL